MRKFAFLLALFMILSAISCTDPAPVADSTDNNDSTGDTESFNNYPYDMIVGDNYSMYAVEAKITDTNIVRIKFAISYDSDKLSFDNEETIFYYLKEITSPVETEKHICDFEQNTEIETIIWDVYTVADEEPYKTLYIKSGTNSEWLLKAVETTTTDKPVIYLYPETPTDVTVRLDYVGELTHTYPKYNGGWHVTAHPDGTLIDGDGREYYCLFWEGVDNVAYDMSEGFSVKGCDTEAFLEDALAKLGLTPREANEFIIYWLPQMENNAYNLISFQSETYTDAAELFVDPAPDTVIRVLMTWKAIDEPANVPPQTLTAPEREGFVLVEWGGCELE